VEPSKSSATQVEQSGSKTQPFQRVDVAKPMTYFVVAAVVAAIAAANNH
jgi:hypothetical protein